MRALQYEGTPAEIAQGFKEQGNSMVKVKRWKDGKEFYTKGIAVLAHERHSKSLQDGQSPGSVTMADSDEEGEIRKEKELHEACYVNRALCNLELSVSPVQKRGGISPAKEIRKLQIYDS